MLFEGLFGRDRKGGVVPAIAEKYEISEDKKTYTFHLRNAHWSDEKPVTANDFAASFRFILDPTSPAEFANMLYILKNAKLAKMGKVSLDDVGIQVKDDKTLVLTLEHPAPYFLELLTLGCFCPTPQHIVKDHLNWADDAGPNYVSNGPFALKSWKHSNLIVLEKNKNYWDEKNVRLKGAEIFMIEDGSTELAMFEEGDLDWAGLPFSHIPIDALAALKKMAILHSEPRTALEFYQFNTERPPFSNEKIRRAFSLAINRRKITENILQNGSIPALQIIPPALGFTDTPLFTDDDTKEAKKIFENGLKELGLTRKTFPPVSLVYNSISTHSKVAQAVQQQWKEVLGIQVGLDNQEWKVYLDRLLSRDFSIARLGLASTYPDPASMLSFYKDKNEPLNHTGWEDSHFRNLLEKAEFETDEKLRLAMLKEAEIILIQGMPIAPLFFSSTVYLQNPRLKDVVLAPSGYADLKWAYFDE